MRKRNIVGVFPKNILHIKIVLISFKNKQEHWSNFKDFISY